MNESREKAFWEKVNYSAGLEFGTKFIERIFMDKDIINKSVIDIGCGIGMYSFIFSQKGAKNITGLDMSKSSINIANGTLEKTGLKNMQFLNSDIQSFDSQNKHFDLIWCHGVIHYIPNPFQALQKMCDLVAIDGILYISLLKNTYYAKIISCIRKILYRIPEFLWSITSLIISSMLFIFLFIFYRETNFARIKTKVLSQFFPTNYVDIEKAKALFYKNGLRIEKIVDSEESFPSADFGLKLRKIS